MKLLNQINDKLLKSVSKNYRNEIKIVKSTKHTRRQGKTDIKEIADEFTNEYESLCSSVPSSQSDLSDVQNCIDFRIYEHCNKKCTNHFKKLSLEDIDKSIKFLRKNKSV